MTTLYVVSNNKKKTINMKGRKNQMITNRFIYLKTKRSPFREYRPNPRR